jgi:Family of unknown function (DUF6352)
VRDFWLSSGHHLVDRDENGGLRVSADFLKLYMARPEIIPPPEACDIERGLHAGLMSDPMREVAPAEIAGVADDDARENWSLLIAFRDHLLRHRTLEGAYLALMREGPGQTPPLFLDQLVHLILRNALHDCDDPFVLRAAEMFFRKQRLTLHEGSLLAADEETLAGVGASSASPLVSMLGLPAAAEIDVLTEDNAVTYWERSDRFDFALDLSGGQRGLSALAQATARWIGHLLGIEVDVDPLVEVQNARLSWYVGLDAEGSKIGDLLWQGEELDDSITNRIIGLFRMQFQDSREIIDSIAAEPVFAIMAMDQNKILRMKPQNLVTGLPLRTLQAVG